MGAYFKDNNGVTRKIAFYEKGAKPEETKTVTPDFASGNVVVTPTSGKVLSQVTIQKDANFIAENLKKDVTAFGVTGTLESGGGTSGGYTVTFYLYNSSYDNVYIKQTNGNDFSISAIYGAGSNKVIFENVTYIKANSSYTINPQFIGITEAELNAGKILTNDIELYTFD